MAVENIREARKVLPIEMHVGSQCLLDIYCECGVAIAVIQAQQGALNHVLSQSNLIDLKIRHLGDL